MSRSLTLFRAAAAVSCLMALAGCPDDEPEQNPPSSQCAANETACGKSCCSSTQICNATTSTCQAKPSQCAAGETACGTACCTASQSCDAATSTCKPASDQCAAGETVCGTACCTASQTCDAATGTCMPRPACADGEILCGSACCTAGQQCDATTSTCQDPPPDQLESCYSPASFAASAFTSQQGFEVSEDGYDYTANDELSAPFKQTLSVGLFPLSATTQLEGTFDLSQEPLSYATCEHCVLLIAGRSATDQKYYLAQQGSLTVTELGSQRIAGTLANVRLVEVLIDENTNATTVVDGGCAVEIPSLAFEYGEPEPPVDEHVAQCFLPASFASDSFRDFIYPLQATVNDTETSYFYRAIDMPEAQEPNLTLFIEVYRPGTGSFSLEGAEVNCPSCYRMVIIEAQARSGEMKTFVSDSGNLVLTELSETAMVGHLDNVRLVETEIADSDFTPVPDGCTTFIERLDFNSADETPL